MSAANAKTTRIIVVELLHADSSMYRSACKSMRDEGRAMLLAVATDLTSWPNSDVVVAAVPEAIERLSAIDSAVPDAILTWSTCQQVSTFVDEIISTGQHFDIAFCIAPEGDNCLQTTVDFMRRIADRVLCVQDQVIQLGSDKLAFHDWCIAHQLSTIPILFTSNYESWSLEDGDDVIVKPRFGAGCEGVRRCQWTKETADFVKSGSEPDLIWQRYLSGTFYSVGVIGRGMKHRPVVLPVAEQEVVWGNGIPVYRGGLVPAVVDDQQQSQLNELIHRTVSALNIHDGYVGFDLIFSEDDKPKCWRLVELNPRLCTSYLGYRRLFHGNLAEFWWNPDLNFSDFEAGKPLRFDVQAF